MKFGKTLVMGGAVGAFAPVVFAAALGGQKVYRSQLPHMQMLQRSLKRQLQWWTYDPSTGEIIMDLLSGGSSGRRRR
jgi:hypothetical protein